MSNQIYPNLISVNEALDLCNEFGVSITTETIRQWCMTYKIGKKVVGQWKISRSRLQLLLEGHYVAKKEKTRPIKQQ